MASGTAWAPEAPSRARTASSSGRSPTRGSPTATYPTGTLQNLTDLPEGFVVSSFLGLSADGYLESDFVVGHVTFFLEKSWLQSNDIHQWAVQMVRFDEPTNSWSPIQAKRVREDETRVYFSVTIPTFSKWVIGGYSGLVAPTFSIDGLTVSEDAKTHQPGNCPGDGDQT